MTTLTSHRPTRAARYAPVETGRHRPRPAATGEPVFVDPSGRRQRRASAAVAGVVLAFVAFLATAVTGVASHDGGDVGWRTRPGAHVTQVDPHATTQGDR